MFLNSISYILNPTKGQTMILTVLVISGTLLSVSLVTGLLLLFQIRQSGDFTDSAKAVFAADAGSEWYFKNRLPHVPPATTYDSLSGGGGFGPTPFTNGASFEVITQSLTTAKIIGKAGNSKRAFLVSVLPGGALCRDNFDLFMVLENSNLIAAPDRTAYEESIRFFVEALFASTTNVMVGQIVFNNIATVNTPLNADMTTVRNNVSPGLNFGDWRRNLYLGVSSTLDQFRNNDPRSDDTLNPDLMLVVTEHEPNRPTDVTTGKAMASSTAAIARAEGIEIHVVGVQISSASLVNYFTDSIASPLRYLDAPNYDSSPGSGGLRDVLINQVIPALTGC